jgi:hypothetical protein
MRERLKRLRAVSTVAGDLEDMLQSEIANGHFRKAARTARGLASAPGASSRRRIDYLIREIECERRRAARDALDRAMRRYAEVEREAGAYPDLLARLYYEGGYVALLQGRHRAAKGLFERSQLTVADLPGERPVIEYWIAADAEVECVVAIDGRESPWSELYARADEAEEALGAFSSTHAQRSINSWNWDRVRIALVEGSAEYAMRFLAKAEDHAHRQTALSGWNTSTLAKRLQLRGSVKLLTGKSESDVRGAAEALTRSVVVLVGRGRQYPEGIRDTLYDLATAVDRLGIREFVELPARLRVVAEQTRDASSWTHPYRAD